MLSGSGLGLTRAKNFARVVGYGWENLELVEFLGWVRERFVLGVPRDLPTYANNEIDTSLWDYIVIIRMNSDCPPHFPSPSLQ